MYNGVANIVQLPINACTESFYEEVEYRPEFLLVWSQKREPANPKLECGSSSGQQINIFKKHDNDFHLINFLFIPIIFQSFINKVLQPWILWWFSMCNICAYHFQISGSILQKLNRSKYLFCTQVRKHIYWWLDKFRSNNLRITSQKILNIHAGLNIFFRAIWMPKSFKDQISAEIGALKAVLKNVINK